MRYVIPGGPVKHVFINQPMRTEMDDHESVATVHVLGHEGAVDSVFHGYAVRFSGDDVELKFSGTLNAYGRKVWLETQAQVTLESDERFLPPKAEDINTLVRLTVPEYVRLKRRLERAEQYLGEGFLDGPIDGSPIE